MNKLFKYDCNGNKYINSQQKINNIEKISDWNLSRLRNILCVLEHKHFGSNTTLTYIRVKGFESQIVEEQLRRQLGE